MVKFLKERKFFLIVFSLSLLSVLLGAFLVKIADEKTLSLLSSLTGAHLKKSGDIKVGEFILYSIGSDMILVLVTFILGFSPISAPITALVSMFSALGVGVSVGYVYLSFSSGALIYTALLLAPSAAVALLGLCLCGEEAMKMSGRFFARSFKENGERINTQKIYKYSLNFLSFSCIIILSGIIELTLNKIFLDIITL